MRKHIYLTRFYPQNVPGWKSLMDLISLDFDTAYVAQEVNWMHSYKTIQGILKHNEIAIFNVWEKY